MSVELLTQQHLVFVSLTGGYTGSSESIHVKMPRYLKSYVTAEFTFFCQDENDNKPVFIQSIFNGTVLENVTSTLDKRKLFCVSIIFLICYLACFFIICRFCFQRYFPYFIKVSSRLHPNQT